MKDRPLYMQIWLVFAGLTLIISLLFLAAAPWTLREFFSKQMYQTIKESQELFFFNGKLTIAENQIEQLEQRRQQYRNVEHVVFLDSGRVLTTIPSFIIRDNIDYFKSEAQQQKETEKEYIRNVGNEKIYYVIRQNQVLDISGFPGTQKVYLLSYMWGSYQNQLVNTLFLRLLWIMLGLLVFSLLPSYWLARYLTEPLITMDGHVRKMAEQNWNEPLDFSRKDEIGRLAQSLESMRQRLVNHNYQQQSFLQHISHELKTPIMVIRSYVQAIGDGVFPQDGLEGSIRVIDQEADRLEKKVKDLLYLTKLDYLVAQEPKWERIDLTDLIEQVMEHLRWQRGELEWKQSTGHYYIRGDYEQWQIVFENVLDNSIRYAAAYIRIHADKAQDGLLITIANNGAPIEEKVLANMFAKFHTGSDGQYGLGLAIARYIVEQHKARIWAANEAGEAAFYIHIPSDYVLDSGS